MFDVVLKHKMMFGLGAQWNYFESGHGKGPCDGLGGSCKRQASEAVKQGKAVIQDARDFYNWATLHQKSIQYRFYSTAEIEEAAQHLTMSKAKVIPGTLKLHAVLIKDEVLFSNTVSCYCARCRDGNELCKGWRRHHGVQVTLEEHEETSEPAVEPTGEGASEPSCEPDVSSSTVSSIPVVGRYLAATYERNWYVGKVLEVDVDDGDTKVTFMEKSRSKVNPDTYKWPTPPDEIWINFDDVLCFIKDPVAIGKSKRQFTIGSADVTRIEKAFKNAK